MHMEVVLSLAIKPTWSMANCECTLWCIFYIYFWRMVIEIEPEISIFFQITYNREEFLFDRLSSANNCSL